jgi:hypothetical protein
MKRIQSILVFASATIASATNAYGQEQAAAGAAGPTLASAAEDYVVKAANDEAARVLSDGSPNSRATAGFSSANLQFTSEQGETEVSLAFSFDLEKYKPTQKRTGYFVVSRTRIGIVATAPLDKEGGDNRLFSGDSLVSGSKLRLSVTNFKTTVGSGLNAAPLIGMAYGRCVREESVNWAASQPDPAAAGIMAHNFADSLAGKLDTSGGFADPKMLMSAEDQKTELGAYLLHGCQPGQNGALKSAGALINNYGEDPASIRLKFLPKNASLRFWGLDASLGRDDRNFLDRTQFKLTSKPRTSWEVGAYYGIINSDLTMSARARVVYGQSYKDNDEAEICRTVSIPAGTECIKGPDGAPLRQRTGLASVEMRRLVTVKEGTQIAFAPQVTYRFEDKNVGVEVPIYLAPDEKGKLSGGIKAVYNSKGDEFAVGLFVGVPFSIFY